MLRWLAAALIALCVAIAGPERVYAQGVTTAALTGRVTDENGAPIVGATVVIRNLATGSAQQTLTRSDGRYLMPALRPGGPYRIEVGSLGYGDDAVDGVQLALGEASPVIRSRVSPSMTAAGASTWAQSRSRPAIS